MSEQPGKRPVERVILWPGRCEACHERVALLAAEGGGVLGWLHSNGTFVCVDTWKKPRLCDAARERHRLAALARRRRLYHAGRAAAGSMSRRIAVVLGSQP